MALFKRNETGPSVAQALSLWGDATPTSLPAGGEEGRGGGGELYAGEHSPTCLSKES